MRSLRNAVRPLSSGFAFSDDSSFRASDEHIFIFVKCVHAIPSERGTAVRMMEMSITAATSSSSATSASDAAASSSDAMANEMEKARSEPRLVRAAEASAMVDDAYSNSIFSTVVSTEQVANSLSESAILYAQMPHQVSATLHFRRLIIDGKQPSKRVKGAPVKKQRQRSRFHSSGGSLFGVTLGNLMHFTRGEKHRLFTVIRVLREQLEAVATATNTLFGDDVSHIIRGLAVHRVLSEQAKKLPELKSAPAMDSKMGHGSIAIGATAAVLIVFASLLIDEHEPSFLSLVETGIMARKLNNGIQSAHYSLKHWRACGFLTSFEEACRAAEIRTLERALAGVEWAVEKSLLNSFDPLRSYKLQLLSLRRAAWPAGCVVDAATHEEILAQIKLGEIVSAPRRPERMADTSQPGVMPLSALPDTLWATRKQDDASSVSSASQTASLSTSSVSAASSDGGLSSKLQRLNGRLHCDVPDI